ncbi:ribonuclease H [Senna tora]|uniref:Ribonuclease H n=1 Tax=Senna tora TaxID=362788 RepID=A0A834WG04_9FABA|nr:ribonuclease H [Senna tora]
MEKKINLNDAKWISLDYQNRSYERLCDLMHQGGFWETAKVAQVYHPHNKAIILDTVISSTNVADNMETTITQKILHFWWKTVHKGLPLRLNLARKGFQIPTGCAHGCDAPETDEHILKDYQYARRVWFASRLNLRVDEITSTSMTDWINHVMNAQNAGNPNQQRQLILLLISLCWSIYTLRQKVVSILHQQGRSQRQLCSLVADYDQNTKLAMLITIRLNLEEYGTEQI